MIEREKIGKEVSELFVAPIIAFFDFDNHHQSTKQPMIPGKHDKFGFAQYEVASKAARCSNSAKAVYCYDFRGIRQILPCPIRSQEVVSKVAHGSNSVTQKQTTRIYESFFNIPIIGEFPKYLGKANNPCFDHNRSENRTIHRSKSHFQYTRINPIMQSKQSL